MDEVYDDPGLQSVASATVTPASISLLASGYGERVENSAPGSSVATVPEEASASTSAGGQVGAVVGRGGAELARDPHPRALAELAGVHPGLQPGVDPGPRISRVWSPSNAPRSQKTSTHFAYGAHA